jgi:DNA-binding transcriptional ArsR family regulator
VCTPTPSAPALLAIGLGGLDVEADDHRLLERASFVYDALYACNRADCSDISSSSVRATLSCVTAQTRNHAVEPDDIEFDVAADVLKLLADPTRLKIVWALLHGEHSVNELADHVGARPPAVSQHLAKLRAADVVSTRRDGTRVIYAARNEHIEHLAAEALLQADHLVTGGRHHRTQSKTA